jgi:uncharacterized protein (DUF1697 family)
VLLRGINLGPHNRIAMPDLRAALTDAGFEDVRTYVQSGNVVLRTEQTAPTVATECETLIATRFGAEVPVIVRSGTELATVVERDPLEGAADDPKRYQVTFLSQAPPPELVEQLSALATGGERLAAIGAEIYAHHPDGIGRSKLAMKLGALKRPVLGTSRNWATVRRLLEMVAT